MVRSIILPVLAGLIALGLLGAIWFPVPGCILAAAASVALALVGWWNALSSLGGLAFFGLIWIHTIMMLDFPTWGRWFARALLKDDALLVFAIFVAVIGLMVGRVISAIVADANDPRLWARRVVLSLAVVGAGVSVTLKPSTASVGQTRAQCRQNVVDAYTLVGKYGDCDVSGYSRDSRKFCLEQQAMLRQYVKRPCPGAHLRILLSSSEGDDLIEQMKLQLAPNPATRQGVQRLMDETREDLQHIKTQHPEIDARHRALLARARAESAGAQKNAYFDQSERLFELMYADMTAWRRTGGCTIRENPSSPQ